MDAILALDQGTTSSRAIVFDARGQVVSAAQKEFPQYFPQPGWVEHDPFEILTSQIAVAVEALACGARIRAIGITNQRETTVLWDRRTGHPIAPAIVWQDRRTSDLCDELREHEAFFAARTGLRLDPYFSGTKIRWLLDHVDGARALRTPDIWPLEPSTAGWYGTSPAVNVTSQTSPTHRGWRRTRTEPVRSS